MTSSRPDRRTVVGGIALLPLLSACAGGPPRVVTPIAVDTATAAALINSFRAASALAPVTENAVLDRAAADQARRMAEADTMSHSVGLFGPGLPSRLAQAGYDWEVTAENLGAGYPTLQAAFAGWVGSKGHRANLLKEGVTEFGIAAAEVSPSPSRYRFYWALILAAPRRPPGGAAT